MPLSWHKVELITPHVAMERTEEITFLLTFFSLFLSFFFFFKVRTGKIHCYTVIQVLALAFLVGIKLSPLAPSFPFFIICLIPLRKLLTRFYKEEELEEVR